MESSNVPGVRFPAPIPIPSKQTLVLQHEQILTRELNEARNEIASLKAHMTVVFNLLGLNSLEKE